MTSSNQNPVNVPSDQTFIRNPLTTSNSKKKIVAAIVICLSLLVFLGIYTWALIELLRTLPAKKNEIEPRSAKSLVKLAIEDPKNPLLVPCKRLL